MKRMEKTLSIFLAVLMIFSIFIILPSAVSAEEVKKAAFGTTGDCDWYLNGNTGRLTISGSGEMGNYSSASDVPWNSVRSYIETIVIESGITRIDTFAFRNCSRLISIYVDSYNKNYSSLNGNLYNKDKTELLFYAIRIKDTSFTIPDSVIRIDDYAFYNCTRLTNIYVDSNNENFTSVNGNLYNKDETELIQYAIGKSQKSFTIPDSVTSIGDSAFSNCSSLTSVSFGKGVTSIGDMAFSNCSSLKSINFGNSVTSIGSYAFDNCSSLKSINIGNSVTSIEDRAFYGCTSLTSITIPNSVTSIGIYAFCYCTSLTSITIPNRVTSIGGSAFYGCTSLTSITIPMSVTKVEPYAFYECNNLEYAYYDGHSINLTIGDNNTPLEKVIQYKGYKETINNFSYDYFDGNLIISGYGEMSFSIQTVPWGSYISAIKSVEIKDGITSIGANAFNGCTNLTKITIPNSVTSIGRYAFSNCSKLTSITIPSQVTRIDDGTFSGCSSLGNITIPDYVTSIGNKAFSDCTNLTSITIPSKVTSIGDGTFSGCSNLKSISIPNSVTSIGSSAFYRCAKLKDISISNTTSYIGMQAFYNCSSLESISIPDGVTKIYDGTFSGCNNLNYAFYNGYKSNLSIGSHNEPLTRVIKYAKDKGTFNGGEWYFDYSTGVLKITGNGNMEFGYNQTIPWSEYKYDIKSVVIESGITSIADYAFTCCTNLISVTIPNTVINIGESAFEGCEALMSLSIPNTVSYIAKDAFYGCKKIQTVNLGSNVFIGDGAFSDCTSLKNVYLSSSVGVIGDNAFSNCTSLESMTIPKCDSPLGQYAFSNCVNLKTVEIKNGLPGIESSAFYGCSSLKTISIPDSVKSIGEEAFSDCNNLTSVTIGEGCKSISSKAFWDCPKLKKITIKYPNCIFDNSQYIISTTAIICGYKNSTAYTYARSYMRSFEDIETGTRYGWIDGSFIEIPTEIDPTDPTDPISSEPLLPQLVLGDVDGDGEVSIIDATCIQRHLAELAVISYNEIAADADGDGEVTILDATSIQRYLAELPCFAGIGNPIS